jgi:hypothetical protein
MTWVPVVLASAGAVLLGGLSVAVTARRRRLPVDPPPDRPLVSASEMRARLLALGGDDSPFSVREQGSILVVTWQLVGIPFATLLFRARLRWTHALELKIDGVQVRACQRDGRVAWATAAATWMPKATVSWSRQKSPVSPPVRKDPPSRPAKDEPRTAGLLVETVRHVVLEGGHRWQPVAALEAS